MEREESVTVSEYGDGEEEDYIDMELSSSPSASASQSREFEFQMSAVATLTQSTAYPADHLFHKGKLLPLYLLPSTALEAADDSYYSLPFTAATPLDISPSESCRASCDLNADDFFFEWSNDLNTFINLHPTRISWPKKLNLIKLKHSLIAHKLKAYFKSLFVKSTCSHDSSAAPPIPKPHEMNTKRKPAITVAINNVDKEDGGGGDDTAQRRSFSSAIKRHSPTKCLSSSSSNFSSGSSSFSLNSNGLQELQCLGRSSSASETEGSIEAAIAHCKKSHQISSNF